MELIDGVNLATWQSESERRVREIVEKYRQAALGLAAAHRVGLVHRDFKPRNALVRSNGDVCVADFGLARSLDATSTVETANTSPESSRTPPGTGVAGTRSYMAPEQAAFGRTDHRSDQFSFCAALYEAVAGTLPTLARHCRSSHASPSERHRFGRARDASLAG